MMGFTMDFTVVTKLVKDKEKVWESIGEAKMIILGVSNVSYHFSGRRKYTSRIKHLLYKTK